MSKHPILKSYVVRFFQENVTALYGREQGQALCEKHRQLCLDFAKQYVHIPKAQEMHYFEQILPFIAAYRVMQQHDAEKADQVLLAIVEKRSRQASGILQGLLKLPGLYKKVPAICNGLVLRSFSPEAGFAYGKVECEGKRWAADIVRCPYWDTCNAMGCPEIAHYFCDSDDMIYGSLHKNVLWKRTQTLGRGGEVCDFCVEIK